MAFQDTLYHLRTSAHLSREKFAYILGVSHQAIQKWETGAATPDLKNIIKIAKHFHVSIDNLLADGNARVAEELNYNKKLQPKYTNIHEWECYADQLMDEYTQSVQEGLEIERYQKLFEAVHQMPAGAYRNRIADTLFELVLNASQRESYPFDEPSEIERIRTLRNPHPVEGHMPDEEQLFKKIHGAWVGRIAGCLLGKPIEGIQTHEFYPLLKEHGNWPMYRYMKSYEISDELCEKHNLPLKEGCFIDNVKGFMPADDDTNYLVMAQEIVENYGRDFTSRDVSVAWLDLQPKKAYCTAERVAYCNFVNGYEPPESASYKNAYRELIGAQIRGDYWGYINPGQPEAAAEMAFRDGCISHVKNGIYGEMFVAAMLSCAAVTDNIEEIILGGLAQIPSTSRLYKEINDLLSAWHGGQTQQDFFRKMHQRFNERLFHDWCHVIPNALIVAGSLLYGGGDFGKSICMAVQACFDTDCNGATVGSILGMRNGIDGIGKEWIAPFEDTLDTTIFGVGKVSISERARMTLRHCIPS